MPLRVSAKIFGASRLRRKLDRLPEDLKKPIRDGVAQAALKVEGDAKRSIQRGTRTGRTYKRTKSGKVHVASAPGEPPKTDFGTLVSSITTVFPSADRGLAAEVGTNLDYGKHLEFGTQKMAARPWLGPAFRKNINAIVKLVGGRVNAALKKAGRR